VLVLNLVLLLANAAVGWRLHEDWLAARAREQTVLHHAIRPMPAPTISPPKLPEPVIAASYGVIAEKMLFSKDRNPTVVVEVTPPPPKPMPPLPVLYGLMNLMDGTTAVMSEKPNTRHQGVRPGDRIGEFTLVAIDNDEITLEWDGKPVTRRVDQMIDRAAPVPGTADSVTPRSAQSASALSAASTPSRSPTAAGPGVDVGSPKLRACDPGDASPSGTVSQGFRKVVVPSPFGNVCRWEPI
jgi:hypothetical protein